MKLHVNRMKALPSTAPDYLFRRFLIAYMACRVLQQKPTETIMVLAVAVPPFPALQPSVLSRYWAPEMLKAKGRSLLLRCSL